MKRGFAILDFETTGLSPQRGDRVLEVGAVYMSAGMQIDGAIETLVNPCRDVGPTRVHGITARDVHDAPTFDRVAPAILDMLDGRVAVGHNVAFDLRFLTAELEREGYEVPEIVAIDTMQVAKTLLKNNPPRSFKLGDVADHLGFGIADVFDYVGLESRPAHSALGDALVTTFLLSKLVQMSDGSGFWDSHLDRAERVTWPEHYAVEIDAKRRGDSVVREANRGAAPIGDPAGELGQESSSASISDVLTALGAKAPSAVATAEYAKKLDVSLDDRVLTSEEVDVLVGTAERLGLDSVTLGSLHRGHFDEVVRGAWADKVLTDEERADIRRVAELLGIDEDSLSEALRGTENSEVGTVIPNNALPPQATVVLTGEMTRDRSHIEAEIIAMGYGIGGNVTKKTALLIVADIYTQSGKAKKARQYGIPVLEEHEGIALLRGARG